MIVSILQLMGFPMGKPVHSRAKTPTKSPTDLKKSGAARRQEVKAKPQKNAKSKDAKAKDLKAKAKPVAKAAAKPAPKKAAVAKKPAAKAVKPTKAVAKPAAKKVAPKPAPKSAKPASKPAAKPAAKPVAKKPAAKAPTKPAAKAAVKLVSKPAPKAPPKAAAKPAAKAPLKAVPAKAPAKATASSAKVVAKAPAKVVPPVVVAPVAPVSAAVPAKTGRPSSRLAQLTVPSMAQTVASTAAKASYIQTTPSPVIVPALPSSIKKDPKLANNWKSKPADQLSDEELMAMPDSEYMNEVQMAAFRNKLVILKRDILNNAGETTEHLREDTSVVPDPADRATIEEEHALELRTRDRERKLLKKIEQSIARIDAGDYGYCDETGEPIGVGRLLARPTATLSLEAQQRRELKQKMFGD
jgi:DnaK suppressor protein